MKTLSEIRDTVNGLIQDRDDYLTTTVINDAIATAVRALSKKKPYLVFESKSGDGTTEEWALSTSTWVGGFSRIVTVYYPWDTTDTPTPPTPLNPTSYSVYEKTAGVYWVRLNTVTPSSSEVVRFYYTSRHSITDSTSTLRDEGDEDSVARLAAGLCLDIMAVRAIAVSGSSIGADTVAYQSRQQQYEAMSRVYKAQSGLASYLQEEKLLGSLSFVSIGKKQRATDNFS